MTIFSLMSKQAGISLFNVNKLSVFLRIPKNSILTTDSVLFSFLTTFFFKSFLLFFYELKFDSYKYLLFFIRLKNIRGMRHIFNLPVNGQRSKTNANTRRKNKLVISELTQHNATV